MCIRWLINGSDSRKMHGATIRFIYIYIYIYNILAYIQHSGDVSRENLKTKFVSCPVL